MKKHILIFLTLLWSLSSHSQALQDFDYIDYTYIPQIRTVEFKGVASQTSNFPVIQLNRGTLYFSFDDLTDQQIDYTYRVIHCDKDWNPSDLTPDQYLEGFDYDEIDNAQFSRNTFNDYVHYELRLPNNRYRWTISGNYLLVIYEGNQRNGVPVITRRFMVAEQVVDANVESRNPVKVSKIRTHQEFNLKVNLNQFPVGDPMREIYVTVLQNGRWDTAIEGLKPNLVSNNQLIYNYVDKLVFPGGMEFRNFDMRSLEFAGRGIHSIELLPYNTNVLLDLQKSRVGRTHRLEPDLNGSFYIDNRDDDVNNSLNPDIDADYANVIFTLEHERLQEEKGVYMVGAFSGWRTLPEYQMQYDTSYQAYIGEALFKQGFYDYLFATTDDQETISTETFEGNNFETQNNYQILIYYREFGSRFDRLLAVKTITVNNR